jgi:adenosine deaminase
MIISYVILLITLAILGLLIYMTIKKHKEKFLPKYTALVKSAPTAPLGPGAKRPILGPDVVKFIKGMPKTALHIHLEGSLEPPMAFAFAKKYNMLPLHVPKAGKPDTIVNTLAELREVYKFKGLEDFLNVYNTLATTLKSKEDFTALAWAYCEKAFEENIRHAEVFFDPQTHTAIGLSFAEVADGIQLGLDKGRQRGLNIQVFCSFLRDHPVGSPMDPGDMNAKRPNSKPSAWTTIKQCVEYNQSAALPGGTPGGRPPTHRLVGVALDNNEVGWPPRLFTDIYKFGREHGMVAVAHAGEDGPPKYIWEAIQDLKCMRIDHGIHAIEDPELVSYMATPQPNSEMIQAFGRPHKLPCTVCPLSNWELKDFPDPTTTIIVDMIDLGIMATVNSDDPAYFGGYVTENYLFLIDYLSPAKAKARSINFADIRRLCVNGFNASVLPLPKKLQYIQEVNDYFLTNPGLLYKDFVKLYKPFQWQ